MSKNQQGVLKEKYLESLKMEVSYEFLNYLLNKNVISLKNCYDINLIKSGFRSYNDKKVDEKYFYAWCSLYGALIRNSYELKSEKDIPYNEIANVLIEVGLEESSPIKALAEIELHNAVLEGKREGEYFLARNYEVFHSYLNEESDCEDLLVDYIAINALKKVFILYRSVSISEVDGCDCLGEDIISFPVSPEMLEIIYKGVIKMGYTKLK